MGRNLLVLMESLAVDVHGGEIEDCGHYVIEEQPEVVASVSKEYSTYLSYL